MARANKKPEFSPEIGDTATARALARWLARADPSDVEAALKRLSRKQLLNIAKPAVSLARDHVASAEAELEELRGIAGGVS